MIELQQISSVENILPKLQQTFTQISSLRILANEHASWPGSPSMLVTASSPADFLF